MARLYTAQEMRDVAQCLHYNSPTKLTIEAAAMLWQAANLMEQEEKRRKKYEYALKWDDGWITHISRNQVDVKSRAVRNNPFCTVVRREVGEWEEVK